MATVTIKPLAASPVRAWRGAGGFLLPLAVLMCVPPLPEWQFMLWLAFSIYFACKWLTWRQAKVAAPLWKQMAYLIAWPGMDADAFFAKQTTNPDNPTLAEWLLLAGKMLMGSLLLVVVHIVGASEYPLVIGWVGMTGLILLFHFGALHLLACLWRSAGITARPLMNWPIAATSLSDFWGRRWNMAFRDLTYRYLFRPLTARIGATGALVTGFIASGLIHDLVISLPARGGYGLPTLYFVVQGAGLLLERWLGLGGNWRGRLFTAIVVVLPAPLLLFHPPFVTRVVLPLLTAWGVLS